MDLRRIARNATSAQSLREVNERRGGRAGAPLWTSVEDQIVRDLYPDYDAMLKALHRRSRCAIRSRVKALGIGRKLRRWTAAEASRLRQLYPRAPWATLFEAFPNLSRRNIQDKAIGLRLRRPPFKFKPTPWPLLNQIRARAHEIGYSMVDLDAEAGTGKYFQGAGWTRRRPTPIYIAAAILALGGGLITWWHDSDGKVDDFAPLQVKQAPRPWIPRRPAPPSEDEFYRARVALGDSLWHAKLPGKAWFGWKVAEALNWNIGRKRWGTPYEGSARPQDKNRRNARYLDREWHVCFCSVEGQEGHNAAIHARCDLRPINPSCGAGRQFP